MFACVTSCIEITCSCCSQLSGSGTVFGPESEGFGQQVQIAHCECCDLGEIQSYCNCYEMLDRNLLQLLFIRKGLIQLLYVGYRSSATVICWSTITMIVYERYRAIAPVFFTIETMIHLRQGYTNGYEKPQPWLFEHHALDAMVTICNQGTKQVNGIAEDTTEALQVQATQKDLDGELA